MSEATKTKMKRKHSMFSGKSRVWGNFWVPRIRWCYPFFVLGVSLDLKLLSWACTPPPSTRIRCKTWRGFQIRAENDRYLPQSWIESTKNFLVMKEKSYTRSKLCIRDPRIEYVWGSVNRAALHPLCINKPSRCMYIIFSIFGYPYFSFCELFSSP